MQKTKLIRNLKLLNKTALDDFGKFINSPYFIERSQLPVLFRRLQRYSPGYMVSKENLFIEAFPGRKYSDPLMRKYISELNKMFEKYLAISAFQKDEYEFTLSLAKEKYKLNNYEEVEKITASAIRKLHNETISDEDHFFYLYKFESLLDVSAGSVPSFSRGESGEQAISTFTDYSAIMILKYYSKLLNNRKYIRMKASVKILDDMIRVFYENGKIEGPLATIYYYIIQSLLESNNTEFYFKLKSLIYRSEQRINKDELRGFYIFLHNYCYEKADYGNREFIKERFEIMQQFLSKGYCFDKQVMKPEFFSSMILNALSLKKIKPAEEFYNNYSETLPKENRISLLNFAMSNILMHKKQFGKAIELLGRIKYNDIFDNIRTRTLYIMIYFESAMYEPLKYQTDSFRHFLKNSKNITSYINTRCLNFLKEIRKMVQYKEKGLQTGYSNDLEGKIVMNRSWLMEKIKEIDNTM